METKAVNWGEIVGYVAWLLLCLLGVGVVVPVLFRLLLLFVVPQMVGGGG